MFCISNLGSWVTHVIIYIKPTHINITILCNYNFTIDKTHGQQGREKQQFTTYHHNFYSAAQSAKQWWVTHGHLSLYWKLMLRLYQQLLAPLWGWSVFCPSSTFSLRGNSEMPDKYWPWMQTPMCVQFNSITFSFPILFNSVEDSLFEWHSLQNREISSH